MTPLSRREFTVSVLGAAAAATRVARATPAQTTSPKTSIGSSTSSPELLAGLTLADVSARVKAGTVTSTALVTACLARIDIYNPKVNAFITVMRDAALAQAKALDAEQRAGTLRGPLHGIPIALKDNIDTAGVRTTAASAVFDDRVPAEDAEVARRLAAAGAVLVGKTNLHEFAFGGTSATSYYGPVRNPWALERNPGGSSGGSAAAVAAGLAAAALGSDTGGSIRQPAAITGTVGIKPTYGRCSRWGIVAFASSLDQAGPIAKTVRDAAIMLRHMASVDPKDSTSVDAPVPDYEAAVGQSIKGLKVGVPKEYRIAGSPKEIEDLWQQGIAWLKAAGATLHDVSLPHTKYALPAYYIVAPAEASSNLARFDGVKYGYRTQDPNLELTEFYKQTRSQGFGREVKRRILLGTFVLSAGYYDAYFTKAQQVRKMLVDRTDLIFKDFDIIILPTSPTTAFTIGEKKISNSGASRNRPPTSTSSLICRPIRRQNSGSAGSPFITRAATTMASVSLKCTKPSTATTSRMPSGIFSAWPAARGLTKHVPRC